VKRLLPRLGVRRFTVHEDLVVVVVVCLERTLTRVTYVLEDAHGSISGGRGIRNLLLEVLLSGKKSRRYRAEYSEEFE
jgi:hypothetical protein